MHQKEGLDPMEWPGASSVAASCALAVHRRTTIDSRHHTTGDPAVITPELDAIMFLLDLESSQSGNGHGGSADGRPAVLVRSVRSAVG